ncbi:hypothetical protein [Nonomuraea helvata]|uniref:Uncharacterized protein n=1 Tax=Nonomuraea helvata TaxID=37484 RepID=A0ABV5S4P1_9ACTN
MTDDALGAISVNRVVYLLLTQALGHRFAYLVVADAGRCYEATLPFFFRFSSVPHAVP